MVRDETAQHRIERRARWQRVAQRAGAGEGPLGLHRGVAFDRHQQRRPGHGEAELAAAALEILVALRQRLERSGAVGDRFVRRMPVERRGGGELVEVQRARVVAAVPEVHRQLGGMRAGTAANPTSSRSPMARWSCTRRAAGMPSYRTRRYNAWRKR
jgi:hypothetical protein